MSQHDPRDETLARQHDNDRPSLVLHGEEVDVHTEKVATGRVRLRKRVVTEEVTVPVTIRREEIEILEEAFDQPEPVDETGRQEQTGLDDRSGVGDVPGDGPGRDERGGTSNSSVRHLEGGDIEITLYAERPVVTMEVVAVERVRVSRGVITDTERVTVDVTHEEAHVEEQVTGPDADRDRRADQNDRHAQDEFRGDELRAEDRPAEPGLERSAGDVQPDPHTPGSTPTGR